MIPLDDFWLMIEEALEEYEALGLFDVASAYRAGAEAAYNIIEGSMEDDGK
jgi:hypothetical protein